MQDDIRVRMREDWNKRAREDARCYIASDVGDDDAFVTSGVRDVEFALRDLDGNWLRTTRALEIGCGAGRMTAFLLPRVRSLCAVDVSTEMIVLARSRLGSHPNLRLMATSGSDLSEFQDRWFDFVLSYVVFQHIPKSIVRQYFRESFRLLRAEGIFRGQLACITAPDFTPPRDHDTFSMRSWSPSEVRAEFSGWKSVVLDVIPITATTRAHCCAATKDCASYTTPIARAPSI